MSYGNPVRIRAKREAAAPYVESTIENGPKGSHEHNQEAIDNKGAPHGEKTDNQEHPADKLDPGKDHGREVDHLRG